MDVQRITPGTVALLWRLAGVILLCWLWLSAPGNEIGLILILVLAILGLARWRFPLPAWTTLVDQAACTAVTAVSWPPAAFALALPAFDACLAARPWFAVPALVVLVLIPVLSLPVAAVLAAAGLAGFAIHLWRRQLRAAREEADRDRRERYELESLKAELLSANIRVARMAEVAERARIARDLHDHAGHEIAAAGLALDAYRGLRDADDPQADELLDEARRRVADAMETLRRTARGISPETSVGVGSLEEICRRYSACPVAFSVHGDTSAVPIHAWGVLEPCLKEALTNASRHEAPARIDVSLDVGPHIVRLCVHNPSGGPPHRPSGGPLHRPSGGPPHRPSGGPPHRPSGGPPHRPSGGPPHRPVRGAVVRGEVPRGRGMGLRSLAQRAGAMGGSVTTDEQDGFRLVCVLPLGRKAPPREAPPGSAASAGRATEGGAP